MPHRHISFWIELSGQIGPPIFAATMVGCLLAPPIELTHLILFGVGLLLIGIRHWSSHHRREPPAA